MDLIKKSASVTENDYKRVTILFFKELGILRYWYDYITTDTYHSHVKYYLEDHRNKTANWYDRGGCMKILGMCDFGTYLKNNAYMNVDVYNLYAAFLSIFWQDEYYKWAIEFGDQKTPSEHTQRVRRFSNEQVRKLIDSWVKLKEALG